MLYVENQQYFEEVKRFATEHGLLPKLQEQLDWLGSYACPEDDPARTRCRLYPDFSPLSFEFVMEIRRADGGYATYFNGGLIYYGPSESGVGLPQLSVSLSDSKETRWEIHT